MARAWAGVQKSKHGRLLEGRTFDGFPFAGGGRRHDIALTNSFDRRLAG